MSPTPRALVIDARPRGPRGPLAVEPVQGRSVLERLLDDVEALEVDPGARVTVVVDDPPEAVARLRRSSRPVHVTDQAPPAGSFVLRTDRLYDRARLLKAYRRGRDPETAAIWRLDTPHGLAGAGDELVRRGSFQPLGRYWALGPARALARTLAPTPVRPNVVTLAASSLFLGAAAVVAIARPGVFANVVAALGLALALVLDTADGHLARLQGTASAFGCWLDGWLDEVGDMALHAAIAWAAYTRAGAVGWLLVGMLYGMGKFVFVAATADLAAPGSEAAAASATTPRLPTRLVRLAGHADVRWHLWIVLAALGRLELALAAYAVYFPGRAVLAAGRKAVRRG
jgi:phosphatidylglycerophosphate synthase